MEAIKATKLTKKYKDLTAVNDLDLCVNEGEIFSLLGVNGAGKTTTIKMLTSLTKMTSGNIKIFGLDILKDNQKIKEIINISPQETAIAPNLTVLENFLFMAGVYNVTKGRIDELVKMFKLEKVLKKKTKTLSGGMQRRVSIAISLINNPKLLFLDEPTLGLDVISRKELWNILLSLKGKMTIILTTHYMEEAEYLSDHIAIMNDGKIKELGTLKELLKKTKTKKLEDAFLSVVGESYANN